MTAPAPGQGAANLLNEPAPAPAPQPAEWTTRLDDDMRGFAQLKGWKTEADVVRSYRELEKFRGVPPDRLLAIPDKEDSPDWAGVFNKLGRPEKIEDYGIDLGDKDHTAVIAKVMHDHGVTKKQAEAIVKADSEYRVAKAKQAQSDFEAQDARELEDIKREWAQGFDAETEKGRRFAKALGLNGEELAKLNVVLGTKRLMKLMAAGGGMIGEHEFHRGDTRQVMGYTPEAAKARIAELKSDREWSKRYLDGSKKENDELQMLLRYANG